MYDVLDICRYIVKYSNEKGYGVSNLKLQKLLYFVQAYFMMEKHDKSPCFFEAIEAWSFGPVVPEAYKFYKMFGSGSIPTEKNQYDDSFISARDKKLINDVVDRFSIWSATDLVDLTTSQEPWRETYYKSEKSATKIISLQAINEYF